MISFVSLVSSSHSGSVLMFTGVDAIPLPPCLFVCVLLAMKCMQNIGCVIESFIGVSLGGAEDIGSS